MIVTTTLLFLFLRATIPRREDSSLFWGSFQDRVGNIAIIVMFSLISVWFSCICIPSMKKLPLVYLLFVRKLEEFRLHLIWFFNYHWGSFWTVLFNSGQRLWGYSLLPEFWITTQPRIYMFHFLRNKPQFILHYDQILILQWWMKL